MNIETYFRFEVKLYIYILIVARGNNCTRRKLRKFIHLKSNLYLYYFNGIITSLFVLGGKMKLQLGHTITENETFNSSLRKKMFKTNRDSTARKWNRSISQS